MQQSLIIKPTIMQTHLPKKEPISQTAITRFAFNIPDIDGLFPGFKAGDFAVLYGPQSLTSLTSLLCLRSQLPAQLGGLERDVVFIDCANNSSFSNIEHIAQHQRLDAETALERIHNMRVYTAYRLTSLIMEKLQEAVETRGAKLVVISDIAVYSQIMNYLAGFAKKHHLVIIATYLPHESSTRNSVLQEITTAKANTVLRFTKTPYTREVELEKHPSYMLGVADLTSENQALTDFMVTGTDSPNYFLM